MTRKLIAGFISMAAIPAFAAGVGLKAGLWQVRLVKQTVDGRDISSQMTASVQQMQRSMANLPPEQRARMEAMLNQSGVSQDSSGGFRICVSPEMAQRDAPLLDKDGRCQPASVTHSGNKTSFQFSCTTNGVSMSGKGDATVLADTIKTHTEVTTHTSSGAIHEMHSDSEMTYLGSDCGALKPPAPPSHP